MNVVEQGSEDPVSPDPRSAGSESGPIGVIVVNYGSHALVGSNLTQLRGAPDAVLIVVDNFSTASERVAIADTAAALGADLVEMPDNRGFGAGVNAGARRARERGCASLLFLNPDASISPSGLASLRAQTLNETWTLVSPVIADSHGNTVFGGAVLERRSGETRRLGAASGDCDLWLTGACLAVNLDTYEDLGGFDESYFLYWEDVEFTRRAAEAGAQLSVRSDLLAVHDEGQTQGRGSATAKSNTYYYYNCLNRLRYASVHLRRRDLLRWIVLTPWASWSILMRGGRRQLLESPKPLWAAVRGTGVGLRIALRAIARPTRPLPSPRSRQ